jgi:hypothetical protein
MKTTAMQRIIFLVVCMTCIAGPAHAGDFGKIHIPSLSVTVENTPGVNVVNTPSVSVVGTPGVTIQNGPDRPVPVTVDPYPRRPFQQAIRLQFPDDTQRVSGSFSVPSGMRLVIETVSIVGGLPADQQFTEWSISVAVGAICTHGLSLPPTATVVPDFNAKLYSSSNLVRLYADPDTEVSMHLSRYPTSGTPGFFGFVSGYLVPVGSPSLGP